MTLATYTKVRNVTGRDECAACIDGWVELAGTITTGDTVYTRGMAPCRWCEQGAKRFIHATDKRRWEPASNFTGTDITPPDPPGRKFVPTPDWLRERAANGISIPSMQALLPQRLWPTEWPPPPPPKRLDNDDPEHVKRDRALHAKNAAERQGAA